MTDSLDHGYLADGTRVPILFGVPSDSGQTIRVFCRFCGKHHTHGRVPGEPGSAEGHRVAHCAIDDSPYSTTGYIIVEVESLPPPAHVIKARYTRDGRYVSSYLLRQRRQLAKR